MVAGSGESAAAAEPLPVYRLTRASVRRTKPLSRARRVGWRYPMLLGDTPSLAYLRESQGKLSFGGITEGVFPRRLFEAAGVVERELETAGPSFRPRLLEVPSLRLYALWLHARAGRSRFIILLAGGQDISFDLRTERELVKEIKAAVAQRRRSA